MYRYLMERLADAYLDPKIENLVFISAEALRHEYPSDAFEDFMENEPETILETLYWKNTDKIRQEVESCIEEKTLAFLMATHQRDGLLAEVLFDEPRNFSFDDTGEVCGWVYGGVSYLRWIYAGSISELIENIIEEDNRLFFTAVKKAKTEK